MQARTFKNRLLRLADLVEEHEDRFDWSMWVGDDWEGKADLSCGTTACAMGWATTVPSLRREGLHLDKQGFPMMRNGEHPRVLFGLTHEEYKAIFQGFTPVMADVPFYLDPSRPMQKVTAKEWAKACRDFVAEKSRRASAGQGPKWGQE